MLANQMQTRGKQEWEMVSRKALLAHNVAMLQQCAMQRNMLENGAALARAGWRGVRRAALQAVHVRIASARCVRRAGRCHPEM